MPACWTVPTLSAWVADNVGFLLVAVDELPGFFLRIHHGQRRDVNDATYCGTGGQYMHRAGGTQQDGTHGHAVAARHFQDVIGDVAVMQVRCDQVVRTALMG